MVALPDLADHLGSVVKKRDEGDSDSWDFVVDLFCGVCDVEFERFI